MSYNAFQLQEDERSPGWTCATIMPQQNESGSLVSDIQVGGAANLGLLLRESPAVPSQPRSPSIYAGRKHPHQHVDMTPLLKQRLAEEKHRQGLKFWLDTHPQIENDAFRPSPTRILRVPGSGILYKAEKWAETLKDHVMTLCEGRDPQSIQIVLYSHETCGAGGVKFSGAHNSDELAEADIQTVVGLLCHQGLNAVYGGASPMTTSPVHTALYVTVDFSGRLLSSPLGNDSFVVSNPDIDAVPEQTALALGIINSSEKHGYGRTLLQQQFVRNTVLCYHDPAVPGSKERWNNVLPKFDEALRGLRASGFFVSLMERAVPAMATSKDIRVERLEVHCMDDRVCPSIPE